MRAPLTVDIPDDIIRNIVADENQKLLLKIEEIIMSAIKPIIDDLKAKADTLAAKNAALKASNQALTEQGTLKDIALAEKDATVDRFRAINEDAAVTGLPAGLETGFSWVSKVVGDSQPYN